jgi:hypothetical protein
MGNRPWSTNYATAKREPEPDYWGDDWRSPKEVKYGIWDDCSQGQISGSGIMDTGVFENMMDWKTDYVSRVVEPRYSREALSYGQSVPVPKDWTWG